VHVQYVQYSAIETRGEYQGYKQGRSRRSASRIDDRDIGGGDDRGEVGKAVAAS
jgi:hypothetical protein